MTLDEILEYGDKPVQPPSIWGQAPKRAEAAGIAEGQPGYEWQPYAPTQELDFDSLPRYPFEGQIPSRIFPAPWLANVRNEKSKARHRAIRRGPFRRSSR